MRISTVWWAIIMWAALATSFACITLKVADNISNESDVYYEDAYNFDAGCQC